MITLPDPDGYIRRFGLGTGMRWGETVRAQASDISGVVIIVHHTKSGELPAFAR